MGLRCVNAGPCVLAQHLNAAAEARCNAQHAVVIEPAVVKIAGRHVRCNALESLGVLGSGVNAGAEVTAHGDLGCRNLNLAEVAIGVIDGCAVNHAVKFGPERGAHTHGAWLARGVERVAGERELLELLCGKANGADFSVDTGVELASNVVERMQQRLAGTRVYNGGAKAARTRRLERARGEGYESPHLCLVAL